MYATRDDLVERFSLTEVEQLESGHANGNITVNTALLDATQEINSYIAVKYALPLPEVPEHLKSLCCDIARYRLYSNDSTEEVETRYKDAVKFLLNVSKGNAVLVFSNLTASEQETLDKTPQKPVTTPIKSKFAEAFATKKVRYR